jgi:hypothetical protein
MTGNGRRRKATLLDDQRRREQQFGERAAELAVLRSGPWAGGWYWRADLERQQEAARLVSEGYGSPLSTIAYYVPTDRAREHPTEDGVRGRVWAYEGPVSERAI